MWDDEPKPFQSGRSWRRRWWFRIRLIVTLAALAYLAYREWSQPAGPRKGPDHRPALVRVEVDPRTVWVDDGDTVRIKWANAPAERVRILGIDAPEVANARYPDHKEQEYGEESRAFARQIILGAGRLELVRAARPDRYGRTLGYLFVDGRNFSVLSVENHMAESTVDRFHDEGFPAEAAKVRAAARRVGPPPFESPKAFRDRTSGRKAG